MGCRKNSSQRKVHSDTVPSLKKKKKRKISNKQPNPPPKRIRKGRTKKILSQQKEGDHKDQRGK